MIDLDRVGDGVFVAVNPIVVWGQAESEFLMQEALRSATRRARICAHKSNDDALHEMLIAIRHESYIQPHKHMEKSESFHIVEGVVDVVLFDDNGGVADVVALGYPGSGRGYFYRLSDSRFHTLLIQSDVLVIHEVTNGPFDKTKTQQADFAPKEGDEVAVREYMRHIAREAKSLTRSIK